MKILLSAIISFLFFIVNYSYACDGMSASVLSNVYMGNNQYQVTIQYCESVSNGAGAAVYGIILQTSGSGTIVGTSTPSFTSNQTGVTINYNQINANTVQWGEWDNNPAVPAFMTNGNPTQCFTIVLITEGPITQVSISGSSASSNLGAGFVSWMGRYCCRMTLNVPPVTCSSQWTPPSICPGGGPINLNTTTSLTGVFSGPGVNSSTGMFDPTGLTFPVAVTFTVGDAGLNCSTTHNIISPYSITASNDQTICQGQSVNLTATATALFPCNYTLNLQDSWGDGWQGGANISVYIDGVLYGNYTLASGSSQNINFPVTTGSVITLYYTAGTLYNGENRIRILNSAGTVIYTSPYGPSTGWLGSGITASCGTNTSFNYSWTPSTGLSNPNIANPIATPSTTTTYTVSATNTTSGCTLTEPVTITVNPGGTPSFNPINNLCQNSTAPVLPTTSLNGIVGTWSPASISTSTVGTTTYTFTPSSGGSCYSNYSFNLEVYPIPTVNVGANQSVCAGTSVTLAATGAATYSWNNGVTQGVAFTPASTQTYTVTGTSAAGCTNTSTVTVTVNPIPVVNAGPDVSICTGGSTTLTATGATSYSWAPGGQTTASISVSPVTTTTYTVTGTSLGCSSSDAVLVSVLTNAPINAGPDVSICVGQSTTLTATGGSTYNWNNGLGAGASHTITPASTTTYTVTGTDANGCVGTDAVVITVNPLPTVIAGSNQTICAGTAITLTATGASTYSWNNGVTQGVSFTPASTQTYTVTGTTAAGCTNTSSVTVTVNTLPTVVAGPNQTVCAGTAVTLNATGAATYSWDNGVNQGVAFTPASTQTYTVTGTSAEGCTNTSSVTVTVNPLPNVSAGPDQTVCDGIAVTLSGSGALTYTWTNSVANGVAFNQAIGQVTYTVTGTDVNGCVNTDQVLVTVNPNPTPLINGASEYCSGSFAVLTTSQPYSTYAWSTGATSASINATTVNNPITVTVTNSFGCSGVSPAFNVIENNVITANFTVTICQGESAIIHGLIQTVSDTYSQTFVTASGCDSVSNVTLIVNPLPAVNAGTDVAICIGQSATLTATGAATYSWTTPVLNGVPFSPTATGTYTVTGTSTQGCVNTDDVIVTVNPLPNVNAGIDQTICIGQSVTLIGSGASTYEWNNNVSQGVTFTPSLTNTYTVTGTDVNGCVNTDQVLVTVNPLPNVGAGLDQSVCVGTSVTLNGSGASAYTWDNGIVNGVAFTPIVGIVTYTVAGTDGNGCINTDQVIVNVSPLPVVNAGNDVTLCFGESTVLNATGAMIYSWSNGGTQGSVSPTSTTTYTVTGTDANGCINTDQITVTVNPIPNVNAGPDQTVCIGATITLTASGASTYTWNNGVTNDVVFTPSVGTTTYTVTGTSAEGCIASDAVIVIVNPLPNVFAGNDISLCEGQSVTLTASGASVYNWDNGLVNGVAFTPSLGTTIYTVTGTSAAGCINSDQVNVTVNPNPEVAFMPGNTLGCAPLTTTFTNLTTDAANCVWTFSNGTVLTGCGTVPVTFSQSGCYDATLTTTSINGCTSSFTSNNIVCVEEAPNAAFTPSSNSLSTLNTSVVFTNNTTGANSYLWDFGDQSQPSDEVNPTHMYSNNIEDTYLVTLIAYSPLGCSDTAYSHIQVYEELIFYVPNTFTPDHDNFNPIFQPVFTSGFDPYDYNLTIFNRWGEMIFESNNAEIGWNGSYGKNGEIELCQDGVYTWKIEFKVTRWDERRISIGHVNLIR